MYRPPFGGRAPAPGWGAGRRPIDMMPPQMMYRQPPINRPPPPPRPMRRNGNLNGDDLRETLMENGIELDDIRWSNSSGEDVIDFGRRSPERAWRVTKVRVERPDAGPPPLDPSPFGEPYPYGDPYAYPQPYPYPSQPPYWQPAPPPPGPPRSLPPPAISPAYVYQRPYYPYYPVPTYY